METLPTMVDPKKFYTYFRGRSDRVGIFSGRVVSMQVKRGDWEIVERIKAHVAGQSRIGIYNHLDNNTCLWAVLIFDEASGNPTGRDSLFFVTEAAKIGLRDIKRERTKVKGENYQCWMFFETPIAVKKVRHLIRILTKKLGLTKVESLPSEDELTAGSVGNFAWLPYFGGIDKWVTAEGDTRIDLGIKQAHTIFIDEAGNPLREPFSNFYRFTEEEIDNAITYLSEYIPPEPAPDDGIRVLDSHVRRLSERCDAFKNIELEIRDKRLLREEGLTYLGLLAKCLNRTDVYHKMLTKTAEYEKSFYDKKLTALTGRSFQTCLDLKNAGYCPKDKVCFEKRPPLIDRFGKYEEDRNKPKEVWREPSSVLWIYQAMKERMGEEKETETVVIDVDVRSLEEYIEELNSEITVRRDALAKLGRNFSGLDCGFPLLNQVLDGLRPDTLIILSGPSGIGKTALMTQIFDQVAMIEKTPCCYVTFGEPRNIIAMKIISRLSGIDFRKIQRGVLSEDENQKIKQLNDKIKTTYGKFAFIVEGSESLGIKKLKSVIDFANPRLILLDSIQSMPIVGRQLPPDVVSRVEQVVQQLKTLARYQKIPIVASFATQDKDKENNDFYVLESVLINMCDVYLRMGAKPVTAGGGESQDPSKKELYLTVIKNRCGDRNIAVKFELQPMLQKLVENK